MKKTSYIILSAISTVMILTATPLYNFLARQANTQQYIYDPYYMIKLALVYSFYAFMWGVITCVSILLENSINIKLVCIIGGLRFIISLGFIAYLFITKFETPTIAAVYFGVVLADFVYRLLQLRHKSGT